MITSTEDFIIGSKDADGCKLNYFLPKILSIYLCSCQCIVEPAMIVFRYVHITKLLNAVKSTIGLYFFPVSYVVECLGFYLALSTGCSWSPEREYQLCNILPGSQILC
jgi:hypothetical protein